MSYYMWSTQNKTLYIVLYMFVKWISRLSYCFLSISILPICFLNPRDFTSYMKPLVQLPNHTILIGYQTNLATNWILSWIVIVIFVGVFSVFSLGKLLYHTCAFLYPSQCQLHISLSKRQSIFVDICIRPCNRGREGILVDNYQRYC